MKNCTPLWGEVHFEVKMHKTHNVRTTFGGSDVEKGARRCSAKHISKSKYKTHHVRTTFEGSDVENVHAVVARSTFASQNVQSTRGADHFWQLRCRKSARPCGAKHIPVARSTFPSQNVQNTTCSEVQMSKKCTPLWGEVHSEVKVYKTHYFRTTFGGSDVASLHYTTLHYTPLHCTTLHYTTLQLQLQNYTPLH